ncbi:hypothetical protein FQN60_011487 [Etheostoma spectabile]|uniref:Uncharacterized protein n=1 Tax=Etheostoma spectabile TaxID=54343 RepID=A0A5J5CF50_9PERO|nr:hypothetical protein FQN60_011487 [Etheostoma spectabile]
MLWNKKRKKKKEWNLYKTSIAYGIHRDVHGSRVASLRRCSCRNWRIFIQSVMIHCDDTVAFSRYSHVLREIKASLQLYKIKMKNYNEDSHPIESHRRHSGYSQSRILEIERAERAEFLELLHRVERLYNSRSRQIDEIRKRMGFSVHQDTLTSPQTTASPILKDDKRVRTFRTNQTMVEEEPFSKKRLGLGSKMAGWNAANRRNPRTHASLSSVDMPTPTELRAISKVSLFTPSPPSSPPPRATRRPSCLPVITTKFGGAVKEVADGCKLQSSQTTLEDSWRH